MAQIPSNSRALATILSPKFGSYRMPWPKYPGGYIQTVSTFVDAGRNLEGRVVGQVIRDGVMKCEFEYGPISFKTIQNILRLFDISLGGKYFNDIEFFSNVHNGWIVRNMYASGDRTGDILRLDPRTGKPDLCQSFRIAFIER